MLDLFREILQTLGHNKLRTALTGLAVAWGIFMLIVLLGMSRGLYNSAQRNNSMEQASYVSVWGGYTGKAHKGYKEGRRVSLEESDIDPVTRLGGRTVAEAMGSVRIDSAKLATMREYVTGGINGVYPGMQIADHVEMVHGRFINERDLSERRKVVVINEDNARLLFGAADSAVGRRVDCMGLSWAVAGVYSSARSRTSYVPFTTAMMLTGNSGRINTMNVRLADVHDISDAEEAEAAVRGVLSRRHEFASDDNGAVHIWNRFENYLQQKKSIDILQMVVWVIGLLTMLSGIVGVSNIMFVSVRERIHEIGVRRAIGAKPRSILIQVLAESVAITAIFGYVGVFLGILVTEVIDKLIGQSDFLYNPRVDINIAVEVTVVLIVVGALAGLFPAIKATKVKPVEALRDEIAMKLAIFDLDNWREIGATLSRNKTRTFLTAFGIFWGTAMLAMLHGGAVGLAGTMTRNFEGFATNMAAVIPDQTSISYKGFNKGMYWSMTTDDVERTCRMSRAIDLKSPIIGRYGNIAYGSKYTSGNVNGVTSDYWRIQEVKLYAGRVLNESDDRRKAKNVMIGKNVSDELFGSDPSAAIGKFVNVNGMYCLCVGVAGQKADASINGRVDDSAFIPLSTMQLAYNTGNKVDFLIFTAKDGYKPKDVVPDLRRAVCSAHPIHPDDEKAFWVMDVSEMFEMVGNMFTGIDLLALFVGAGTLMAGIIGVGNIMWIIVRERTREIGIRRAIGAKPRDVIVQILSESSVLTVVAGTAGITFAAVVLYVADMITSEPGLSAAGFQLSFTAAVVILVLFLVLGTAAGLIPSLKAMRIKPVEAMREK